ncbi:molybdopterin-dependent oxidoreductase [Thermodesulfobacteriota bacterium]
MEGKKKSWTWQEDDLTVVRSMAANGMGCHEKCGVLLYTKNGKLVKVEGDHECPFNLGRICPRCAALPEVVYHPDRLKYPLKRTGKRGEDKWERISWDEALDTIADKFNSIKQEFGSESVIFCQGTGRGDIMYYHSKLTYSFGSPNKVAFGPLHGHACNEPKRMTMRVTLGSHAANVDCSQYLSDRYDDLHWTVPKCIIIWGIEPTESNPSGSLGHWFIECMKRGTELIVIDPRKTWLASRAKMWLQVRPGTDAALALGMLNVIINEKLYDVEFVEKWTYGFDKLKERVQAFPPERVAQITWIPERKIIEAARFYAASKPAGIQMGVALEQSKECIGTIHGLVALYSITGNLDVPGGNTLKEPLFGVGDSLWDELEPEQQKKKIGTGKYPLCDDYGYFPSIGEVVQDQLLTGEPYPIKAAWIQATNTIACGAADAKLINEGFKKLDFNVVIDLFMTPTAMSFADIVLPATTYAERDGFQKSTTCLGTTNKAIEPIGECKSDVEINLELGKRLNPAAWPWDNVHGLFDSLLEPMGLTFAELRNRDYIVDPFEYRKYEKGLLRSDGKPGFRVPTGKVELYSTSLEKCGLDPLPYYEEPPESPVSTPGIEKDFPLVLTTGARKREFFHSEHRQIPSLRKVNPDPITELHPDTAAKLGIADGDWVYIENSYGRCKQKAKLTKGIDSRVVHSQHGWWFPEMQGEAPSLFGVWESNINLLLPGKWTGRAGLGYPFKTQMCKVYKAKER